MDVARGHVTDRPFARTFYTVAARRFTGDLILSEGGRQYKVSWEDGRVVAADSPSPADSAGRVALAAGLVTSTHVARSLEILAQSPGRDSLEVLAELARLSPGQIARLKRRLLAHRAARVFALPSASFVLDNARSLRADPEVPPVDARWLIYFGLRTHYTVDRLERELAPVAGRALALAGDARGVLPAFGFSEAERALLARLGERAYTADELVAASPEVEPRIARAVFYALVACDCLEERPGATSAAHAGATPPRTGATIPPRSGATIPPRTGATIPPRTAATIPPRTAATTPAGPAATTAPPAASRPSRPHATTSPPALRTQGRPSAPPPDSAAAETLTLIKSKLAELDAGADHYTMLGVSRHAAADEIRTAYFGLAKRLHPDRLRAVGLDDATSDAQRLFSRINLAFGALSDPKKRAEYDRVLSAGGEEEVKRSQADAEELAARVLRAEETFHRGEMALRRNQVAQARALFEEAVSLNPDEAEYQALLAWCTWLLAEDKAAAAPEVQRRLTRAINTSPRCVPAHFYLGKVCAQSGRPSAAIAAFKLVLELSPEHAEASLELRLLMSRERRDDGKRGLLDRLKKR